MQTALALGAVFVIFTVIFLYDWRHEKKKQRKWIKDHYGIKPQQAKKSYELAGIYWEEFGGEYPEDEIIDEVTWNDLDMNYVFDRINNCISFAGEQLLYSKLHHLPKERAYQKQLEEQITYYETNSDKREQMQLHLSRLGKEESNFYLPLFISNLEMLGISNIWFYRGLQVLLVIAVLFAIFSGQSAAFLAALVVFLFNAVVYAVKKAEHEIYLDALGGIIRLVKVTNSLLHDKQQPVVQIPDNIRRDLKLFRKMTRMVGILQKKKQAAVSGDMIGMLRDYLIGATLWDFTNYDKIIRFLRGKEENFMEIYQFTGMIDMSISVASFRKSLPFYCIPKFTREKILRMEELYHPLIQEPVCNTVTLDNHCMITGSNASGKSTFIKAVVINAILAQNIHTCTAKHFTLPSAGIITSMAIRDDIMSGESYYMKEIKYLNRIIENLSDNRIVICAIDEILRGTNTRERIAASAAVLKYLSKANCLALIASHDVELIEHLGDNFYYYYFCDRMSDKDIKFDYKIQEGISNTNNAIRLLEYVGFPEEIITEARYNYSH